ncbi:MAG: hypothetical protein Kapaf2KO_03910 [Candidatus Kapaibacteriales bacterium]
MKNTIGIALILLGLLLILGIFFDYSFWGIMGDWWPLLLIGAGLYILSVENSTTPGLIVLAAGVSFQLEVLQITNSFWILFFPLLLIIIGIGFITGKSEKSKRVNSKARSDSFSESKGSAIHDISAVMASTSRRVSDPNFSYASISAVLGSCNIDLRECIADGDQVKIGIKVVAGSVEMMVPMNWRIISKDKPVLGSVEDMTSRGQVKSVDCILDIECIAGSVEIRD